MADGCIDLNFLIFFVLQSNKSIVTFDSFPLGNKNPELILVFKFLIKK